MLSQNCPYENIYQCCPTTKELTQKKRLKQHQVTISKVTTIDAASYCSNYGCLKVNKPNRKIANRTNPNHQYCPKKKLSIFVIYYIVF